MGKGDSLKSSKSDESCRIKELEARVQKLELLLQVSPKSNSENMSPLSHDNLEQRVACLEERLTMDDSLEIGQYLSPQHN